MGSLFGNRRRQRCFGTFAKGTVLFFRSVLTSTFSSFPKCFYYLLSYQKEFRYLPEFRGHARLNSNPSARFGSLSLDQPLLPINAPPLPNKNMQPWPRLSHILQQCHVATFVTNNAHKNVE